jgi:hypothetical protein
MPIMLKMLIMDGFAVQTQCKIPGRIHCRRAAAIDSSSFNFSIDGYHFLTLALHGKPASELIPQQPGR